MVLLCSIIATITLSIFRFVYKLHGQFVFLCITHLKLFKVFFHILFFFIVLVMWHINLTISNDDFKIQRRKKKLCQIIRTSFEYSPATNGRMWLFLCYVFIVCSFNHSVHVLFYRGDVLRISFEKYACFQTHTYPHIEMMRYKTG